MELLGCGGWAGGGWGLGLLGGWGWAGPAVWGWGVGARAGLPAPAEHFWSILAAFLASGSIFGAFSEHFWRIFGAFLEHFWSISRLGAFSEHFPSISRPEKAKITHFFCNLGAFLRPAASREVDPKLRQKCSKRSGEPTKTILSHFWKLWKPWHTFLEHFSRRR